MLEFCEKNADNAELCGIMQKNAGRRIPPGKLSAEKNAQNG